MSRNFLTNLFFANVENFLVVVDKNVIVYNKMFLM